MPNQSTPTPTTSAQRAPHHANRLIDPSVLLRVLARCEEMGPGGLVIFDLDSTLLDNRPRQARILREFGASSGIAPLLRCEPTHFDGWSLKTPMLVCGIEDALAQSLEPQARQFWLERFFTSEYCTDDICTDGARAYVARIQQTGVRVVYCTGRHPEMRDGTLACFSREGIPLPEGDRVHLLMKPTFQMHDDDWKRVAKEQLLALGTPLAAFDNEPAHINNYRDQFPQAQCVHLLTDDSARQIPVYGDIPSVTSFAVTE